MDMVIEQLKLQDMTREELIILGKKIVNCGGTEKEIDIMIELFNRNVPHPNGAGLFYYPENYNARRDDLSKYNPTVEEVVDKALSYKPIQL
jgi:hypothetical protein